MEAARAAVHMFGEHGVKFSVFPLEDQVWLVLRVGVAAVLGGLVGWEHDRAGKTAGIRTHMLVAASAALAVGLGELVLAHSNGGDPTRMMHAVFTGIGFIGGGMIFTQKGAWPVRDYLCRNSLDGGRNRCGMRPRRPTGWPGGRGFHDFHFDRGAVRRGSDTWALPWR